MKKSFDLAMPRNHIQVSNEEMEYISGGTASIPAAHMFLNKSVCYNTAYRYLYTGLDQLRIAQEIYAHTFLYYSSSKVYKDCANKIIPFLGGVSQIAVIASFNYIKSHANPIDIGGDSDFRVMVFKAIWNNF